MKKTLAIIMAMMLLFSSVSVGIVSAGEGEGPTLVEDTSVYKTAWYFDFSTKASYDDITDFGVNGNLDDPKTQVNANNNDITSRFSVRSYDESVQAMKLMANNNAAIQLDLMCNTWRSGLDYKKYKTLALKVKLSDTSAVYSGSTIRANDGAAATTAGNLHNIGSKPAYKATTDWQLILISLDKTQWKQSLLDLEAANDAAGTSSVWWGTRLVLSQANYTGAIYVQWAGIFLNDAYATEHYKREMGQYKTNWFFDFASEASYNDITDFGVNGNLDDPKTQVNANNNDITSRFSVRSYDESVQAMKLTANNNAAIQLDLMCNTWRTGLDYKVYKTLALKVKLSDTSAVYSGSTIRANDGAATSTASNLHNIRSMPVYQANTDWQLVLVNLGKDGNWKQSLVDLETANEAAGTTSVWWGTRLVLSQANYTGAIYVQWAGIFASDAAATNYYNIEMAGSEGGGSEGGEGGGSEGGEGGGSEGGEGGGSEGGEGGGSEGGEGGGSEGGEGGGSEGGEGGGSEGGEGGGETPAAGKTIFYYDFTSKAGCSADWVRPDRFAINGNLSTFNNEDANNKTTASVSYSYTNRAVKVVGNGSKMVDLDMRGLDRRKNIFVNTHTVFAMKVKLSDTNAVLQSAGMGAQDGNATAATLHVLKNVPAYAATTDWQLVLIDLSSANWGAELTALAQADATEFAKNVWWAAHIDLAQEGYTAPIYVQWAGVFTDAAAAQAHYDNTPSPEPEPEPDPDFDDTPNQTKWLFDFSTEEKYNNMVDFGEAGSQENPRTMVNYGTGPMSMTQYGALSFDATNGALKLVGDGTNAPALDLRCHEFRSGIDIKEHEVLALKVKLTDPNTKFQIARMYANDGAVSIDNPRDGGIVRVLPNAVDYASTDDWQLLIVDISSNNYDDSLKAIAARNEEEVLTSTWWGTYLTMGASGETAPIYVAWAGIFKNEGKALAYYAETTENLNTEALVDFSSQEKYDAATNYAVAEKNTESYDDTNKALKLTATDGAAIKLDLQSLSGAGLDIHKTKALALKVKLGDTSAQFGGATVRTSADGTLHTLSSAPAYRETDEWQVVVVNLDSRNWGASLKGLSAASWDGASIELAQAGYTGDIYVAWAGFFTSESNAAAYFIDTTEGVVLKRVTMRYNAPKPTPPAFFYNFSTEAVYKENEANPRVVVTSTSSTLSYDAAQGAMKVVATKMAPFVNLQCHDRRESFENGLVLAVKVKITSPAAVFQSARMFAVDNVIGDNSIPNPNKAKELREYPRYANTDGWQLLLVDLSDANRFDDLAGEQGQWYGVQLYLGVAGNANPYYIQWAGVFKDTASAQKYFDYTTPADERGKPFDENFGSDQLPAPTPVFWNFTSEMTLNRVEFKGDTTATYDSFLRVMKIVAGNEDSGDLGLFTPGNIALGTAYPIEKGVKLEDYPVFAIRVKLTKADTFGGMVRMASTVSRENVASGFLDSASVSVGAVEYRPTTKWQTVIIDYRDNPTASFFIGGDWVSFDLELFDEDMALAGDTIYVKWAGAFASKEQVLEYVLKSEGKADDYSDEQVKDEKPDDSEEEEFEDDEYVEMTDEEYVIEYVEEVVEEYVEEVDDDTDSTKKTTSKKTKATKPVKGGKNTDIPLLLFVGIGVVVVAIGALVVLLYHKKKRAKTEE